jgi:hypothetical protein
MAAGSAAIGARSLVLVSMHLEKIKIKIKKRIIIMPMVGKKKYPYTKAGKKKAKMDAKKSGKKVKRGY